MYICGFVACVLQYHAEQRSITTHTPNRVHFPHRLLTMIISTIRIVKLHNSKAQKYGFNLEKAFFFKFNLLIFDFYVCAM